jgi:hypothetical protein
MKAPNVKLQAPNKFQTPISNFLTKISALIGFEFWSFSGAWSVGFGAL